MENGRNDRARFHFVAYSGSGDKEYSRGIISRLGQESHFEVDPRISIFLIPRTLRRIPCPVELLKASFPRARPSQLLASFIDKLGESRRESFRGGCRARSFLRLPRGKITFRIGTNGKQGRRADFPSRWLDRMAKRRALDVPVDGTCHSAASSLTHRPSDSAPSSPTRAYFAQTRARARPARSDADFPSGLSDNIRVASRSAQIFAVIRVDGPSCKR